MNNKSLFQHLWKNSIVVALLATLLASFVSYFSFSRFYKESVAESLRTQGLLLIHRLTDHPDDISEAHLLKLAESVRPIGNLRFTYILPDGKVLADSHEKTAQMDNHANRPEIKKAIAGHEASSIRRSPTLGVDMMYMALPVYIKGELTGVLRLSKSLSRINEHISGIIGGLGLSVLISILVASILALTLLSRVRRDISNLCRDASMIAKGHFDLELYTPESSELADLSNQLATLSSDLKKRIQESALQTSELEAVFAGIREGIVVLNKKEEVVNLNDSARQMLALSGRSVYGQDFSALARSSDLKDYLSRVLNEDPCESMEIEPANSDGKVFMLTGNALYDIQSKLAGAVLVLRDITKARRLEDDRRQFISNASHELKTPLTSMVGYLEALHDDKSLGETSKKMLDGLTRNIHRLRELVEDLFHLNRLEEKRDKGLSLEPVDLAEICSELVEENSDHASRFGVTLEEIRGADLKTQGNSLELKRAFQNLIENAIKYSGKGSVIQIETKTDSGQLMGIVRDNGVGIPPAHIPSIFNRFYRVNSSRNRDSGGSGLGLAIAKGIVEAHGGKITLHSEPGKGCEFICFFPINKTLQ